MLFVLFCFNSITGKTRSKKNMGKAIWAINTLHTIGRWLRASHSKNNSPKMSAFDSISFSVPFHPILLVYGERLSTKPTENGLKKLGAIFSSFFRHAWFRVAMKPLMFFSRLFQIMILLIIRIASPFAAKIPYRIIIVYFPSDPLYFIVLIEK